MFDKRAALSRPFSLRIGATARFLRDACEGGTANDSLLFRPSPANPIHFPSWRWYVSSHRSVAITPIAGSFSGKPTLKLAGKPFQAIRF